MNRNQRLTKLIMWVVLTLCAMNCTAKPLVLNDNTEQYPLGLKLELLEDPQAQWSLSEVLAAPLKDQFVASTQEIPNFAFTDSAYWAKITLQSQSKQTKTWLLEVGYAMLDKVDVSMITLGRVEQTWQTGDLLPFAYRPIEHTNFVFPITFRPNQRVTLLIRVQTRGSTQLPLTLYTSERFIEKTNKITLGLGLYFGIMLVMMLYNTFIYVSVRDKSYLYYVLYIAFFSLGMLSINGLAYQYLWPDSPWWANRALQFCLAFYTIWMLLFARRFLRIKDHNQILYRGFLVMMVLNVLQVIGSLVLSPDVIIPLIVASQFVFIVGVLVAAIVSHRQGFRPARFFLFAFAGLMVGGALRALLAQGLVPNVFITEYGVQIGSALEVILLSLALADRINLLQKQANDKDQLARENAEKANQAKSIFIANISHEIRTPLNAVLGYTQMLERDRKLDEKQQHSVGVIAKSSEHLLEVINDILDISKIEANAMTLAPVDFELVDLVEGIGVMFEGRCIDKNLTWHLQSQCNRPIGVYGDQVKLRQILINLLGNAVKFTRKGTVGLHLSSPKPGHYHFEVTDNGPGIDQNDHDEIFTAFGQTLEGSKHGGTGLGLAIASKQVDLMGGKLQVSSQPNLGSRFFFTLRLADAHGPIKSRHNRNNQTMKLAPGVCISAMVVDDIKDNRTILRQMLEAVGIDVTEAENGLDGLNQLHQTTALPDLVFIDIRMPIMDGIKMLRHIHHDFSGKCPNCIVVTAHAMQTDVEHYLNEGFDHYIAKPFRIEAIYECIHHLLDVEFEYHDEEKPQ